MGYGGEGMLGMCHAYIHAQTHRSMHVLRSLTGVEFVDSYYRKNTVLPNIANVVNEVACAGF